MSSVEEETAVSSVLFYLFFLNQEALLRVLIHHPHMQADLLAGDGRVGSFQQVQIQLKGDFLEDAGMCVVVGGEEEVCTTCCLLWD